MITDAESRGMFTGGKVFKKVFYPGDGWSEPGDSETFPRSLIPDGMEAMPGRILRGYGRDRLADLQKISSYTNLPVLSLSGQATEKHIVAALKRVAEIGYTHLHAILFRQIDVEIGSPPERFSSTAVVAVGLIVKEEKISA